MLGKRTRCLRRWPRVGAEARGSSRGRAYHYHPVGTYKNGTGLRSRRGRRVNSKAFRGLEGVYVADCSIMPVVPRASTTFRDCSRRRIASFLIGARVASRLLPAKPVG